MHLVTTGTVCINAMEEDWKVECSDDEKYLSQRDDHGGRSWEPSPEDIIRLYTTLVEKGTLELEWRCPGRRSPSVHSNESEGAERRAVEEDQTKMSEPNEFDFDDDEGPDTSCSPKITPRRRAAPASSVQKRVAKFDKVVFDVRRQRELDAIDKIEQRQQPQQAESSSSPSVKR